jgi:hypothetical protein
MTGPLARAWRWWDDLWFGQVDARLLGLFRIALGLTLAFTHLCLLPEIEHLLGSGAALWADKGDRWWEYSVYDGIADLGTLRAVHVGLAVPPLLMALGIGGRLSTLASYLSLVMVVHANSAMLNSGDLLLRQWNLILLVAPATRALSVDAWVAARRGRPLPAVAPRLALRLVQLQLAWMYFDTGLAKMLGDEWTSGRATYYALHVERLQRFPDHTTAIMGWAPVIYGSAVMTYITVYWELLWPLLVLWRPTRRLAIALGLLIHGGIAATLMVAQFSAAATMGYLAYLDPDRVGAWLHRRFGWGAPPA